VNGENFPFISFWAITRGTEPVGSAGAGSALEASAEGVSATDSVAGVEVVGGADVQADKTMLRASTTDRMASSFFIIKFLLNNKSNLQRSKIRVYVAKT
jgi:hypothetical protein